MKNMKHEYSIVAGGSRLVCTPEEWAIIQEGWTELSNMPGPEEMERRVQLVQQMRIEANRIKDVPGPIGALMAKCTLGTSELISPPSSIECLAAQCSLSPASFSLPAEQPLVEEEEEKIDDYEMVY